MARPKNTGADRIAVRDRLYARLLLRTGITEAEGSTYAALVQSDLNVVWAEKNNPLLKPLKDAITHYELTGDGCVKRARELRWLKSDGIGSGHTIALNKEAVKQAAFGEVKIRKVKEHDRLCDVEDVLEALNEE